MLRIAPVESNHEVDDACQNLFGALGVAVYTFTSPTDAL